MAEKKPIRVLLVDDHAVVRSGLSAFLLAFDDLELAGEAGSGEEAVKVCTDLKPDVVLMDLSMPGMGGVEATKQVLAKCPGSHVIVLTSFKEKDMVEGALKAGALSYLLKNVTADELASAIRGAAAGRPSLSPEAAQVLIHDLTSPEQKCGSDLTQSEREVLALMVEGLSNKEIAERSDVSQSTVKFHVSNILSKLGGAAVPKRSLTPSKTNWSSDQYGRSSVSQQSLPSRTAQPGRFSFKITSAKGKMTRGEQNGKHDADARNRTGNPERRQRLCQTVLNGKYRCFSLTPCRSL